MSKKAPKSTAYDADYYEKINNGWIELKEGKIAKRLIEAVKLGGMNVKGKNILDVGCGRGELCHYLAGKGATCTGIDYSQAAIKIANKKFKRRGVQFKRMDSTKIKFKKESFDLVFMMDIVEHLTPSQLEKTVGKIYNVLKPNGLLVIHTMPNAFLAKPFYLLCKLTGTKRGVNESVHVNEQTIFSLKKLLNKFDTKIFLAHEKDYFKSTVFYSKFRTKARPLLEALFQHDFSKVPFFKTFIASEIYVVAKKRPRNN